MTRDDLHLRRLDLLRQYAQRRRDQEDAEEQARGAARDCDAIRGAMIEVDYWLARLPAGQKTGEQ